MRFLAFVAMLVLVGLSAAGESKKEPELTVTTSDAGRFKAGFTTTPKVETRSVKSDAGPLEVATASAAANKDLTLSVTWTDYPESFRAVPADKLLAAVRDGMKSRDARLVSEKDVSAHDPNPAGKEILLDFGKYQVRCRQFLVGTRLYQVTATGTKAEVAGRLADKFLASFELIGR